MKPFNLKNITLFILLIIIFLSAGNVLAQETVVVGQILNKSDQTPISSVNIYFKNSEKGVQSNEEGYFLIRNNGPQSVLVFSAVGFRWKELRIKPGQSVGVQVEMEEENTLLREIFVIPGANPALELMKRARLLRKANDISNQHGFAAQSSEQQLVLLSKINQRATNRRIFDQLKKGNISSSDSILVIPLYMAESKYQLTQGKKVELSKNVFSSPENGEKILEKMVGDIGTELNFYENSISVFGKNIISPLSGNGYAYYNFYLADSVKTSTGKQYEIHFRTKNSKNLAFNGTMKIDSASLALINIEAELPLQANINYIHNLRISENFEQQKDKMWALSTQEMSLNMNYGLLADSLHPNPEIFVKRSAIYQRTDSANIPAQTFAQSEYSSETLDDKLKDMNNTPLLRTAKWIADVMFTGYMNVGKIDIGKVQKIIRITDIEGLRLTLPFRTNENLWKNVSLGGYVGYGFKNQLPKYSAFAQYKLPGEKRRIFELSYTNDYRRVDYNYNDFLFRENPLITGDEDISSSVFAFKAASKISERNEYLFKFSNEWTRDIESDLYLRSNRMFPNAFMPMQSGPTVYNSLLLQSATLSTRFSFGERRYDDHMQRIHISNAKPVIYSILEYGKYQFGDRSGEYGKVALSMRQLYKFDIGMLHYILDAGWIFGNVPYQLLQIPHGSETGGYSTFQFNMMNYSEYAADKYVNLHTELMFNGILMNHIPVIKNLNLREMCSFNLAYGGLSDSHKLQLDYPGYMYAMQKPYMEVGVGFTNILSIFTLQSVWRLTDLNHPGVTRWGLRGCLNLNF